MASVEKPPYGLTPDITSYLDAFHAFDTITEDLAALTELATELAGDLTDPDALLEVQAVVEEDKLSVLQRRDHILRSFIGSAATRQDLLAAAGLYVDEYPEIDKETGLRSAVEHRAAINRVRSYTALIALTQYEGAVPAMGGVAFPKQEASRRITAYGKAVRLYGTPDEQGRGLWVDITNPRGVAVLSPSRLAAAQLAGDSEVIDEPLGPKITGMYEILASYEHADRSTTVTALSPHTDQTPFTVHVPLESRTWRLDAAGTTLELIIPDGATSASAFDMEQDFPSAKDEAAMVAYDAAGGPQQHIFETFDTTNRHFNPAAVPTAKRN